MFPNLKPKERVSFATLELLAATGLSRFDYRVGGHHVHASAYTLHLNRLPPEPMHLLALSALRQLAADVEPLLDEAVQEMERREERVQRRPGRENWRRSRTPPT